MVSDQDGQAIMAQFVTNADEVLRSSRSTKKQMVTAMHYANRQTAKAAQGYVRDRIPPPNGNGRFPGYAATGGLRGAVQVRGPMPIAGGIKSDVFMADDRTRVYRAIHEFGGIIRARSGGWLRFPKPPVRSRSRKIPGNRAFEKGGYVFAKAVRITAKHYWRDGWKYGETRFQAVFEQALKKGLPR